MEINICTFEELPEKYHEGLKEILTMTDDEFVPPLSARVSTTQECLRDIATNQGENPMSAYFQVLSKQSFIIAVSDDAIVGFLSYLKNKSFNGVPIADENIYVSTICVHPEYRRSGLASRFYDEVEKNKEYPVIYTRTWSKNQSHIHLLEKRGYKMLQRIADDRGVGIDTIYYAKEGRDNGEE
jgi:ribosomal protein S18 acetylase RimI-like enzyme